MQYPKPKVRIEVLEVKENHVYFRAVPEILDILDSFDATLLCEFDDNVFHAVFNDMWDIDEIVAWMKDL